MGRPSWLGTDLRWLLQFGKLTVLRTETGGKSIPRAFALVACKTDLGTPNEAPPQTDEGGLLGLPSREPEVRVSEVQAQGAAMAISSQERQLGNRQFRRAGVLVAAQFAFPPRANATALR